MVYKAGFLKTFNKLCPPAALYFIISAIALIASLIQNFNDSSHFCFGFYECPAPGGNNAFVFLVELIYVIFWTWVLHLICNAGYTPLSWVLVLFPIILMFVASSILIMEMNKDKQPKESSGATCTECNGADTYQRGVNGDVEYFDSSSSDLVGSEF